MEHVYVKKKKKKDLEIIKNNAFFILFQFVHFSVLCISH